MNALKALVKNGRIVVDEPTDLPEGTELQLVVLQDVDNDVDEDEREAFLAALDEGIDDADAGRVVDASVVLERLRSLERSTA
ncbi:MAG: hypothetical protein L6Q84_35275 [Polyangiaceae bacterium]|nr:hypothetical protein [Polyangiaceae bacterium]